jgi:transaldolase
MTNRLREIEALGQAVWIDNINRELLDDGILQRLVDEDGISGVTSNPTIFEKAMGHSERYDEGFKRVLGDTQEPREVFFRLAYDDIRDAADVLHGVYEATGGQDGYVSFELPPELAFDAAGSVEAAKRFHADIGKDNVLIKVPGTAEGVEAFEELTASGISVNVTLLFDVRRYVEIAEAYVRGLERRAQAGEPVDRIASVASFFVSRVDSKVDAALDELGGPADLKGKAAVANAKVAFEEFGRIFSGARWDALAAKGANVQRPLWASTSTKNPDYPDTLYVDELIGPDTVNTMPEATLDAFADHGTPARTVDADPAAAQAVLDQLAAVGVDLDDVAQVLEAEGVAAFSKSFDELLDALGAKAVELGAGS